MFNELKHVYTIKRNQNQVQSTSIDDLTSCKDKIKPVANHRRQSINKAHPIPHLQLSKKILGAIQYYLHHIKPSIGVRFKILVGAPLFCPLDGQTKGGVSVDTTVPEDLDVTLCQKTKTQHQMNNLVRIFRHLGVS
jgi:hypothetical protein